MMLRLRRGSLTARRETALSFVICSTARSGTSFLSGLLASTRRVGLAQEWFKLGDVPEGVELEPFVAGIVAERLFRVAAKLGGLDSPLRELQLAEI